MYPHSFCAGKTSMSSITWTIHAQVMSLPSSKKGDNSAPYWKLFIPLSLKGRIPSRADNGLRSRKENTELNTVKRQLSWCSQVQCWDLLFNMPINYMKQAKKSHNGVFRLNNFWILRSSVVFSSGYCELLQKNCMMLTDQAIKWTIKLQNNDCKVMHMCKH